MGISLLTISTRLTLLKYHNVLLRLTGDASNPSAPSWEIEVINEENKNKSNEDEGGGAKGIQEERLELENNIRMEEKWRKRLEEVQKEMEAL